MKIAEFLRRTHSLRGIVEEFRTDENECSITFKGPGYGADVFIQRESGKYEINELSEGPIAWLNDLHKGRHTGSGWSLVIDITAVLLIIVSASGLVVRLFIKRRRRSGLLTVAGGTALLAGLAWWLIR